MSLLLDVKVAWCRIANSGSFVTKEVGIWLNKARNSLPVNVHQHG